MNADLSQQINELVKEKLPEATANEMRKFIEEAKQDKIILKEKIQEIESYKKTNKELNKVIDEYKTKDQAYNQMGEMARKVTGRENAVEKRENTLELTLAKMELEYCSNSNQNILNLTSKVFGHPSVTVTNRRENVIPQKTDEYGNSLYTPTETLISKDRKTTTVEKD
jgi:hypothetical protein